jgi:hypothetical protein
MNNLLTRWTPTQVEDIDAAGAFEAPRRATRAAVRRTPTARRKTRAVDLTAQVVRPQRRAWAR